MVLCKFFQQGSCKFGGTLADRKNKKTSATRRALLCDQAVRWGARGMMQDWVNAAKIKL